MRLRACIGSLLGVALLASLLARPAAAELLQVPEEHPTIAEALAAASFGDTVSIAPGTYYEHDLLWPPGVSIHGRSGVPESVIIDGLTQGRVIGGENLVPQNEIAYLTIRGGHEPGLYGSGLMAVGDPVLHDLIIEECTSTTVIYGIGLYVKGGATITDCVLRNNRSSAEGTRGGGACLLADGNAHPITARNLEVYGNQADTGDGIYFNDDDGYLENLYIHDNFGSGMAVYYGSSGLGPIIENSLFANNAGSGLTFDASLTVRNCTFVGNGTVGSWVGAISSGSTWDYPKNPTIEQCIVVNNLGSGISWWDPTPYTIACNNVYGNAFYAQYVNLPDQTGYDGNISADPEFCGASAGNFGLQADSPCAPANNTCGLLMGAYPVACGKTSTQETSWGAIKALY